ARSAARSAARRAALRAAPRPRCLGCGGPWSAGQRWRGGWCAWCWARVRCPGCGGCKTVLPDGGCRCPGCPKGAA
ncbi:MAG: hypothetical protein LBH76_01790, partial [Propionibacteriaceae bacterium]|nr:hypothetical protein [Propionibacteriaceae bacterium]